MIITISGDPGAGKSSVAERVAERLGYRYVSIGILMRELAKRRGITLLALGEQAKTDPSIDRYLDDHQRKLGDDDRVVIDSRLGFHFVPESFKVFLSVSDEVAAQRVHGNRREDVAGQDFSKVLADLRERKHLEYLRYRKHYGVDLSDRSRFDLVIETDGKGIEEIVGQILSSLPS